MTQAEGLATHLLGVAGEHATARVPVASPKSAAGHVRASLCGQSFDSVHDVVVLEGDSFVGVVSTRRLLAAVPETQVAELLEPDPAIVRPDTDQERAASKMVARGEASIVVLDEMNRFVGLIPPHTMLAVLVAEHEEDLARLGGYMAETRRARHAAEEPVVPRLWHRLPWLLLGLVGAMGSAGIVGAFENQLDENVLLAFFVPAVVYLADAVGTQTEVVLIRGLSVGIQMRKVVPRELVSGVLIGLLLGGAFLPFALAVWGDADLAVAVALALVASCSIATVVAMLLPWGFHRLGRDPAFGSGPLATVIQDLLSIAVYLGIATAIAA